MSLKDAIIRVLTDYYGNPIEPLSLYDIVDVINDSAFYDVTTASEVSYILNTSDEFTITKNNKYEKKNPVGVHQVCTSKAHDRERNRGNNKLSEVI